MGSTLAGIWLCRLKDYREVARIAVQVGEGSVIEVVRMVKP